MKILYIAQRLPYPPNRGDRIPTFNHIRFLSREHSVYVASLLESAHEMESVTKLLDWAESVTVEVQGRFLRAAGMAFSLLTGRPLSMGHFFNAELQESIRRLIREQGIEAVVVFSSSMAQYVEDEGGLPRIMNFCDMDSQKWADMAENAGFFRRLIYRREARLLLEYERKLAKTFAASCVVTDSEADLFRRLVPGLPVTVVANGVDYERFAEKPRVPSPHEIAFVGVMDYGPNIEAAAFFVRAVWPRVRERHPEARFNIVGARPTREVKALAEVPGVHVTGFVADVRDYLSTAALVVVPLDVARGIQNKILEAMAAGAPVLTTPVAAKGLSEGARETLFIESRADESAFAAAVLRLLESPGELERKAAAAQAHVRAHYSWESSVGVLDGLLGATAARSAPADAPAPREAAAVGQPAAAAAGQPAAVPASPAAPQG